MTGNRRRKKSDEVMTAKPNSQTWCAFCSLCDFFYHRIRNSPPKTWSSLDDDLSNFVLFVMLQTIPFGPRT